MKLKVISITLLMILLLAPVGQLVYAQDTGDGDTGDDGTGDGTGEPGDTNSTLPDTNTTIPIPDGDENSTDTDGEDDGGDGNIDSLVVEQIRTTTQLRYQELYQLMFGTLAPAPDDGTDGENVTGTESELPEDNTTYTGPVIPEDADPALRNAFMHAWQAMQQGEDEDTNPQAAANAYMRALKQLRNAYRKFEKDNPTVVDSLTATNDTIPDDEIPDEPTDDELNEIQQQLVERFQERFQERLTSMYENYNNVSSGLSPDDAVKALNALTKAEQKLLRIQARIDAGNTTGALDDLDNATDTLDDDFDSLDDAAARQMFKTMNKLEERIQKMEEKAARKAAAGEDTSEEDALLAELKGNKNKTKDDYKTNNGNSGNSGNDKETGKPDKEEKEKKPKKNE
ncbi:MAG: hypothetical protein NWF07_09265 [Candidatus Bathyarchaeota archaeon]|nr:hypothetical protein [Candidatus Bathyarchaeota archaeon]